MKRSFCSLFIGMHALLGYTQNMTDTASTLQEVIIYPSKPSLLQAASSVIIIEEQQITDLTNQSLIPVMNSIAGIRMEERSPGSYRLSIRGSLLRSPFGIRNIKIYMDEFPLTDAGGNTYLNLIDANSILSIQVLKGPESSMFGANTGGVILLQNENKTDSLKAEAAIKAGSFGLMDERMAFYKKWNHYSLNINQTIQQSEGYRVNSALQRNYLNVVQKWRYKTGSIKLLILGSQLHYETPGGLTFSQQKDDPQQARPETAVFPGAKEQKAGVYNSTIYAGISNEVHFISILKHVITVFGSGTDFKNPFITNYEIRKEYSSGIRTYIEAGKKNSFINWKLDLGLEAQQTKSNVANYDNKEGRAGQQQDSDDLISSTDFIFSEFSALIRKRFNLEAALSINHYRYDYRNIFPVNAKNFTVKRLEPQLMPRMGISYQIISDLAFRISASKGYSPPTLAELRPSDNNIYQNLQPESGWNYESGLRFKNERWDADIVIFRFDLKNAIVRRTNDAGAEYFINAGSTRQMGIEFQFAGIIVKPRKEKIFQGLEIRNGFTYYDFIFRDYSINTTSYSGNKLTGVPQLTNMNSIKLYFPKNFNLVFSWNYTGYIPLNDANSISASPYHVLATKLSRELRSKNDHRFTFFAGAENILNVQYSLGNDLNAAGGRYYNPAPARTYYGGIRLRL